MEQPISELVKVLCGPPGLRDLLFGLAMRSIQEGLQFGRALVVNPEEYPVETRICCGVFVTLRLDGALRGCVGTLEPVQPLVRNVAHYAFLSAFGDRRFPALTPLEFGRLEIQISILSEMEELRFDTEEELVAQLRPSVDGLLLADGHCRGTLLPAAWNSSGDRRLHLQQLKQKAGFSPDHWSPNLRVQRYETYCI
jgi:uncharacterized protein